MHLKEQQLGLFPPTNSDVVLELSVTKQQIANVRRGLFKRFGELNQEIIDLKDDVKRLSALLGIADEDNSTSTSTTDNEANG